MSESQIAEISGGPFIDQSSGGGGPGGMDRRIERLEDKMTGIAGTMGEIRGEMKHLATKEDLGDMKATIAGLSWKIPVSMVVLLGAIAGIAKGALLIWGP